MKLKKLYSVMLMMVFASSAYSYGLGENFYGMQMHTLEGERSGAQDIVGTEQAIIPVFTAAFMVRPDGSPNGSTIGLRTTWDYMIARRNTVRLMGGFEMDFGLRSYSYDDGYGFFVDEEGPSLAVRGSMGISIIAADSIDLFVKASLGLALHPEPYMAAVLAQMDLSAGLRVWVDSEIGIEVRGGLQFDEIDYTSFVGSVGAVFKL